MRTLSLGAAALAMFGAAGCMDAAVAHSTGVNHAQSMAIGGDMRRTLDQDGDLSLIGGNMDLSGRVGGDVNLVGGNIDLDLAVGGELSVAGGNLDVAGSVARDASIAGGDIEWRADVGEDLEIAGGDLTIDADITRDLEAASGELHLSGGSRVGGDAEMAAGEIRLDGRIDGTLEAAAGFMQVGGSVGGVAWLMADPEERNRSWRAEVDEDGARAGSMNGLIEITGTLEGDVYACGRRVSVLRNASIAGTLHVWAEFEPQIAADASPGNVVFEERGSRECDDIFDELGAR